MATATTTPDTDTGPILCAYCREPIEQGDLQMRSIISRTWKDRHYTSPPRPYHKSKGCAGNDQMAHEG